MRTLLVASIVLAASAGGRLAASDQGAVPVYGPQAALDFELSYRGKDEAPGKYYRYPAAKGIPFADTDNIIPLTAALWKRADLAADFRKRMASASGKDRKAGIIVLVKTERCCTKVFRGCSVTTAALAMRSTPVVDRFLVYGAWIKPRDGDKPAGSLKIETGADAWKNNAAGEYEFEQGPGATVVVLDPTDGSLILRTDAARLHLDEKEFIQNKGKAPFLESELQTALAKLSKRHGGG